MEAAKETDSPVIVQASRGARSYSQDNYLRHLMLAAAELYPSIPITMHQDHGNSPVTCQSAIDNGFTSVMMDGSLKEDGKTPGRLRLQRQGHEGSGDARPPRRECRWRVNSAAWARSKAARARRKTATAPTGKLSHDQLLTDPDEAARFVAATGVDALAVAIGTSHGAYKFTRKPDGDVLAMKRIEEIHAKLPNCHLVMHGSSSVPQELQDIINKYGGKMPQTWGVPVEEIQKGHQARRAEDQRRHRLPDGDHRCDPQGARRGAGEVRSPRLPQAVPRGDEEGVRGADGAVRSGWQRRQDQVHHARGHGGAVRARLTVSGLK